MNLLALQVQHQKAHSAWVRIPRSCTCGFPVRLLGSNTSFPQQVFAAHVTLWRVLSFMSPLASPFPSGWNVLIWRKLPVRLKLFLRPQYLPLVTAGTLLRHSLPVTPIHKLQVLGPLTWRSLHNSHTFVPHPLPCLLPGRAMGLHSEASSSQRSVRRDSHVCYMVPLCQRPALSLELPPHCCLVGSPWC